MKTAAKSILEKFHLLLVKKILIGLISLLVIGFATPNVYRGLKTNLTHSDASVNYQATSVMNNYFANKNFSDKPVVITILSPYQIDFFSNHSYDLLPLSKEQYFTLSESQTWGIAPHQIYLDVYKKVLSEGRPLFVSNYHTGPDFFYLREFENLERNLRLQKVAGGCNGSCDLFQIDSR